MGDLASLSSKDLLKIKHFGKKSVEKVERELAKHDLALAEEKDNET